MFPRRQIAENASQFLINQIAMRPSCTHACCYCRRKSNKMVSFGKPEAQLESAKTLLNLRAPVRPNRTCWNSQRIVRRPSVRPSLNVRLYDMSKIRDYAFTRSKAALSDQLTTETQQPHTNNSFWGEHIHICGENASSLIATKVLSAS